MNNTYCPICKSEKLRKIEYRNPWSDLFEKKSLILCDNCGFGHMDPKVDSDELLTFYKDTYRSKGSPHYTDFSKYMPHPPFKRARSISQILLGLQYLPYKKEYNYLDLGAGLGKSFISAKEVIPNNVNLHAIEEDKEAKKYYHQHIDKNITIYKSLSEVNAAMDVVLMSHSLEHFDIEDIPKLLSDIYSTLNENGIMIIEVPHADLRDAYFEENRAKDTPHLCFFSLESLKQLVEASDFELCFINTTAYLAKDYIRPLQSKKNEAHSGINKSFKTSALYKYLSKVKRSLSFKIRSCIGKDDFYKEANFYYGGNRIGLRCVLRKPSVTKSKK